MESSVAEATKQLVIQFLQKQMNVVNKPRVEMSPKGKMRTGRGSSPDYRNAKGKGRSEARRLKDGCRVH